MKVLFVTVLLLVTQYTTSVEVPPGFECTGYVGKLLLYNIVCVLQYTGRQCVGMLYIDYNYLGYGVLDLIKLLNQKMFLHN